MEKELRTNAKRLSPEEQFQIRKSIIRMSKQGKKVKEIAELLDVSERHVKATRASYKKDGFAGISLKQRGRKAGDGRTLTPDQEKPIRETIVDKNPEQLKLKGCMWTRKNIAELVKQLYGISMPLSTLGYYLERWGFSVQRPIKRAYSTFTFRSPESKGEGRSLCRYSASKLAYSGANCYISKTQSR